MPEEKKLQPPQHQQQQPGREHKVKPRPRAEDFSMWERISRANWIQAWPPGKWTFGGCYRTFSYEHVLTIASNAPWNKRATKRFNIFAGFNPRSSRFHRGFDNGEAEQ